MSPTPRIQQLEALEAQLFPLKEQAFFLNTQLYFAKEQYTQFFREEDKKEIISLTSQLNALNSQIIPLATQAKALRIRYLVEYQGEYADTRGNKHTQVFTEDFYFVEDYQIDTFLTGWGTQFSYYQPLIAEIWNHLHTQRFTNVSIRNIKRI